MDRTTFQHRCVNPNVSPVVPGRCAQNTRIIREITLREGRHHVARTGTRDAQANRIPDREYLADPGILHEIPFGGRGLHHDVRAKPSDLEPPLRIQFPQAIERGRGQQMHDGRPKSVTVSR